MQPNGTKGIQEYAWLGGIGNPLGIVKDIRIWPYWQLVYPQARICLRKWDA